MRVALCLSGFPRTMEYAYPYLKKYILDELNPDIFYFGYSDITNNISPEDVINKYNPKSHLIREFNSDTEQEIWDQYALTHEKTGTTEFFNSRLPKGQIVFLSQSYNILGSNNLKCQFEKDNNFVYDVVIRGRTDYYFFRKIDDNELDVGDYICIPEIWDFDGHTDGFAYGNSANMDIYSSLFNYIAEYGLRGCEVHPETLLKFHFEQRGLSRRVIKNHWWWQLEDFVTKPHLNPSTHSIDGSDMWQKGGYGHLYIDNINSNPDKDTLK